MTKDRRLGKGLAALLGTPADEMVPATPGGGVATAESPTAEAASASGGDLLYLQVHEIEENPFQPRRDFGEAEIATLAESLKEHQMLQPVLVRKIDGRYQLISGERRLRAAIRAGLETIPARLREADDRLVAELAIVENLQRKDLNPIEKALSFKRYLEQHECTQDDLAQRLKIDRSTLANLVRLLELPEPILNAVREGSVSAGHARALLPLGEARLQLEFAQRIRTEGMSVRAIEKAVQQWVATEDGGVSQRRQNRRQSRSQQVVALERELKAALGTRVDVQANSKGKGKMVIHFADHDEFERLYGFLVEDQQPERRAA